MAPCYTCGQLNEHGEAREIKHTIDPGRLWDKALPGPVVHTIPVRPDPILTTADKTPTISTVKNKTIYERN